MRKSGLILISLMFLLTISFSTYAQETETTASEDLAGEELSLEEETEDSSDILDQASEEYSDETLEIDAGTTPGQFGYFIDDFFDQFGNDADVMAEKFAEMKQLLAEGKKEEAKIALEKFREYAKELQENANPEDRDKIRKYMAAINHELASLRGQGNDDLINEVEDGARDTLSAIELSKVIQNACKQLIELSASDVQAELQFNNLCKPSDDSSKWHKGFYEDLTQEQQKEVKQFVKAIKQCFRNPTDCDCSAATDNQAFVNSCELITKAEVDCRAGDETACQSSKDLGEEIFQSLADKPYLREALEEIEREFSDIEDDRFDNHLPEECKEAGATDRKSCMKVMFSLNAPEECVAAAERGEIDILNHRESRKQCEEIMFNAEAPEECIDAGIKDFKECGKFMFKTQAPQECIDAGLTGESQRDHKKCESIMDGLRGEDGPRGERRGPGINFDCRRITDSEKRLECFDKVASGAQEQFDNRGEGSWPSECREAGATTPESCGKVMREFGQKEHDKRFEDRREFGDFDNRGPGSFNSGRGNFRQGPPCNSQEECEKFRQENPDFRQPQEEFREGEFSQDRQFAPPQEFKDNSEDNSNGNSGSSSTSESSESSSSSGESSGGITGGVISGNNRFLDYYFRFF